MKSLNPLVDIDPVDKMITEDNFSGLVSGFDLIINALDNLNTSILIFMIFFIIKTEPCKVLSKYM
ncbi:MAG: hypothetical protein JW864_16095 [Spirochaetes bacterium]|nr:hypothetical protein [Spirochaetota bacterium]